MTKQSAVKKFSFEIIVSSLITLIIGIYFVFPPAGQAEVETADSLNKKVMSLFYDGQYEAAFPIAMRVLSLREKTLGPDHYQVAVALQTLAGLYEAVGDYENAAPLDKRALKILEPESDIESTPAA